MLFPFQRALRARVAAHSLRVNAPDRRKRATPACPDLLARAARQDPNDIFDPADRGNGALRCLITELGHAAQAGWAPTIRWIALLLTVAMGAALFMAVWK
jgi:hypothetical protein